METQVPEVHAVDDDVAARLVHAEEGLEEGGLAGARAPHNANLLRRADAHRHFLQHIGQLFVIAQRHVVECDLT